MRPRNVLLACSCLSLYALDLSFNDELPTRADLYHRLRQRFSQQSDLPARPHVVVLGTGWSSASFVRKLNLDDYRVTIVSPRNFFLFTPLLAGTTVGTVEPRSIVENIRSLLVRSNASDAAYLQAECMSVDPINSTVMCRDSSPVQGDQVTFSLAYDHLVNSRQHSTTQPNTTSTPQTTSSLWVRCLESWYALTSFTTFHISHVTNR